MPKTTLARRPLHLAREVRADRDGIRTFVAVGEYKIKFEVVLEARIELAATLDPLFDSVYAGGCGINALDQWGRSLGKNLAEGLLGKAGQRQRWPCHRKPR